MRAIPAGIQAGLDSGAATHCTCWKVTLASGAVLGFTNHDKVLDFDGVSYEPQSGYTPSEVEVSLGLAISTQEVEGVLDSSRIVESDLRAGLWDGAEVVTYLVDWSNVTERMILRTSSIGQVRRGEVGFGAEMRGPAHELNQAAGRFYKPLCDVKFGSAKCGIDLDDDRYKAVGAVASSDGSMHIYPVDLKTVSGDGREGLFIDGEFTFTSGANTGLSFGVKMHIGAGTDAHLILDDATPYDIADGDTFTATRGCDKLFATCNMQFGNRYNFRGFNLIPGNDRAMAPVDPDDEYGNDGSSLFGGGTAPDGNDGTDDSGSVHGGFFADIFGEDYR